MIPYNNKSFHIENLEKQEILKENNFQRMKQLLRLWLDLCRADGFGKHEL
jgi:hypothetical protein